MAKTRNCGSRKATLAIAYKLLRNAQRNSRQMMRFKLLELVANNVEFKDGEQVSEGDRLTGRTQVLIIAQYALTSITVASHNIKRNFRRL